MKFCDNCGQGNQEDAAYCSNCGTQLKGSGEPKAETGEGKTPEPEEAEAQSQPPEGTPAFPPTPAVAGPPGPPPPGYPAGQIPYYQPPPPDGMAIASLILSIASFIACPLIGAVLGLVFGYIALRNIRESNGSIGGEPFARAGIIISWVNIGLTALVFVFVAIIILIAAVSH